MLALIIVYDSALSIGISLFAAMQEMLTGVPGYILRVFAGFCLSILIYNRLLKHPDSGAIGFKSACYVSLATTSVRIVLSLITLILVVLFGVMSHTFGS